MWPNPQIPADLVTFTEEIRNWKLHFLCSFVLDKYRENFFGIFYFISYSLVKPILSTTLKELWNCFLCIICVWSLFCSVCVDISLHFLPIPLLKLGFNLSGFWFFVFLYVLFLVFGFSFSCFEFNVISEDLTFVKPGGRLMNHVLHVLVNFIFTLFKQSVKIYLFKYKNRVIKKHASRVVLSL